MPKCLLVTGRDPLKLYGGDINRLEALVRHLGKRFNVEIVVTNAAKTETLEGVDFRGCRVTLRRVENNAIRKLLGVLLAVFKRAPIQSGIFINPFIQKSIRSMIFASDYEVIVFHLFRTFFDTSRFYNGRVHVDLCDAQSRTYASQRNTKGQNIFLRLLFNYEYFHTQKIENWLLSNNEISVSLINAADLEFLKIANNSIRKSCVLPNLFEVYDSPTITRVPNKIAVVGNFNAYHNKAMVDNLILHNHSFLSKYPATIVGQMSTSYAKSLPSPLVTVKSNPGSINHHLWNCEYGLCVLPFGSGFQTKLIDYANAGLVPVVSPGVALGAGLINHKSCLIVEDLRDISKLLKHSDEQKKAVVKEFKKSLRNLSLEAEHNWNEFVYGI